MSRTVVHLLRHGEVFNPEGVLYGRLPGYVLSDLGHEMAGRAATALAGNDITAVISSPMERAQQTAAPMAAAHSLEISIDDNLIEAENIFEGQRVSVGDGVLKQPRTWRHLWNPFKPSWGEPYDVVAARMHRGIDAAREQARGHEAVLVSHQPSSVGCGTTRAVGSAPSRRLPHSSTPAMTWSRSRTPSPRATCSSRQARSPERRCLAVA